MIKNILLLLIVLLINSAFCSDEISQKPMQKVSLQLQWKHQFEFAGFYIAKEKGFYKDVGLDIELIEFDFTKNIINDVCNGRATYGTSYPSSILEKFNGKDIVLLSAILQLSPHILVSLKSSGIKSIEDFKNKKIMIENNALLTTTIKSMLKSHYISFDDMIKLKHTFNIDDLINGKTDITTAFSSNELYALDKKDIKYDVWDPKNYGFDFYDLILFTSTNELKNNPQRVANFREASLKGWKYAFDHIEETVELILKKYNTQNRTKEALLYEAKVLKKLAYANTKELGSIDKNKIQRIYDMYNLMGLIHNKIEFDKFIYKPKVKNNISTKNHMLNEKERVYLENKKQISMCIDPDWMPFEKFDKDGNHIGISRDYFDIFEKKLNIPIKVIRTKTWSQTLEFAKSRKCDIISMAMETPLRKQYMNFTTPYLSIPLVLATRQNVSFVDNFNDIQNKKVGIVQGYAMVELLRKKYTNLNIIEVKNVEDGLNQVSTGELFGFIGSIADVGYIFQTSYVGDLKITGKFDERWELGIAIRNDDLVLLNIFEKVVNSISEDIKQQIFNKYIAIKYEKGIDYTLLWRTSIGFIVALFIVIFFLIKQNKLKRHIEHLNENLELKIKQEVEKNRQKDKMIFKQSKLASMGEMIGNIAHQWRQPLNRVNLSLEVIDTIIQDPVLDKQMIEKKIKNGQKNLRYMSDTIEDFANFFRADKQMAKVNILKILDKSIELLGSRLDNIDIIISSKKDIEFKTYESELLQVILIVLNNALDNFEIKNIMSPKISILLENEMDNLKVSIIDNGGGITKENVDKIFDPYFTTKFKKEGTGLGLYMAKMIIEESMGGELHVLSNDIGATFLITLTSG